ncbi:MAG: hypothetical protein P4M12_02365 [Gammaproteobacteria bacterium]|nr:hypothetical protein [Gammaproteobacteria bacterium]
MKLRTLAITAMSGLFAVSLAYAEPASMDDANGLDMADNSANATMPGMTGDVTNNAGENIGNVGSVKNIDMSANPTYAMNNDASGAAGVQNAEMSPQANTTVASNAAGSAAQTPDTNANANDDISADTATGDDDY